MDFASFSLNYWDDLWQSRHQIMSSLAVNHKVLFVSPPFYVYELQRNFGKNLPPSGLVQRSENLHTLVFPKWQVETSKYRSLSTFLSDHRKSEVRKCLKRLGFKDTVLFIWHPRYADLVGEFDEILSCYYVDDEFSSYVGMSDKERERVIAQENELLRKVDVVFANGPALLAEKNQYGNAISLPMSADFDLFSRGHLESTRIPEDIDKIPHPRIGHIGNINDKIDFRLLKLMAVAQPKWSFVLVGPVNVRSAENRVDLEALKALPNVYFLGAKPRELLPNYVKGLDVCMMGYRTDGWAHYIYPLKLHEYLASGKPIIGSGLPSFQEFKDVMWIAETPEEWLRGIQAAIDEKNPHMVSRRIQVAYDNRLEKRIEVIEKTLEEKLREKLGAARMKA
jgi:glycosyltransferase involved in cell wall biosynthesis